MSKVPLSPEEQQEEIRRRMPGCLAGIPWIFTYAMYQSMSISYNKTDWFRFAVGCLFWVYIVAQALLTATPTGEAKEVHRAWGWAGYAVTACAAAYCHLWH